MDIKSMLQGLSQGDDRKKKYIIIALIILFLLSLVGTSVYFLTKGNGPSNEGDVLSGWEGLAPRGGTATSSLKRLPFIELAADHPNVAPGQESKISWVVSNATACVDGNGDPIDLTGSLSISPTEPYTFDVLCTGPNGTQSQTITIGVSTAPIIELIATPSSVLSGKQSYVSWNTINADRCEDSKGETLRLTGGFSIKPTAPYTYSMSCTGEKGTTKKSITVGITTPFATGTGTGTSGGTTGTGVGAYTDTSTGLTYNSDGSLYTGISYGIKTGGSSEPGIKAPASTISNLSGKSFVLELTISPNPVPFGTTAKVSWRVTNLGTTGSCTVETSNNVGTAYLPLGSIRLPFGSSSYAVLSDSKRTHNMTEDEIITLTCTKGSERIVVEKTLTVGPPPPVPDPEIKSFSVTLEKTPKLNYGPTGSVLVIKWETNHPDSKIDGCMLWRNDGVKNEPIKLIQKTERTTKYNEWHPGRNVYALQCSRGEGDRAKVATMTSETPDHISIVNCQFPKGFGAVEDVMEMIDGEVVLDDFTANGTRTPTNEPICTYTHGDKDSMNSLHSLWGFQAEIRTGSENFICPYTVYTAYKFPDGFHTSGNPGVNVGWWRDTVYHSKWEFLESTPITVPTSCGGRHGLTYWVPYKAAYSATSTVSAGDGGFESRLVNYPATQPHFETADIAPCGPPILTVNSVTCLVK